MEIKDRFTGLVIFATDAQNLNKNDFSNLDLRRADLRRVNLSGADLSGANLLEADLSGANLSRADLGKKNIYQISRIGCMNRTTTYDADNDIIWCGCFVGSISKFEDTIKNTYTLKSTNGHNYMQVVKYFKSLKK